MAEVAISFDSWPAGRVAPSHHQVEVVAAPPGLILEPVSPRLKASLIHSNRRGIPGGIAYSSDGRRIIAGDYPGGVIQVWDAETGEQLTTIDVGRGYRSSSEYFSVTPDWKTVFAATLGKRKNSRFEQDGKEMIRWEFEGAIRGWDLATGELKSTFSHTPPRNIATLRLSPDGSTLITGEELPGDYDLSAGPKGAVSLWDAETGQSRTLAEGLDWHGVFSPDSKTLAIGAQDGGYNDAIKFFDVATGEEKLSIPITEGLTWAYVTAFSPDGRLMLGSAQKFPERDAQTWRTTLKVWDAATGHELASYPAEHADTHPLLTFCPDGRTVAASWFNGTPGRRYFDGRLSFYDVRSLRPLRTVDLAEQAHVSAPAFSPDGRWLAVTTRFYPDHEQTLTSAPEDQPQPRIHLVEVATGELLETLVAPQGFSGSLCFSPDGNTLATAGQGKVLLWDLIKPPIP